MLVTILAAVVTRLQPVTLTWFSIIARSGKESQREETALDD